MYSLFITSAFYFIFLFGACAKPSEQSSQTMDMRIAKKPDYVHHLSDGSNTICSVTFINEYQAFTAAHCLLDPETGSFVPTRKVRLTFNETPGKDKFVPIVSACYHPEFSDYYRQSFEQDINKVHINPVSLSPFDFAIIQIGVKECNADGQCGNLKGTSLGIAAQETFGINYKEQLKLPGNTPPTSLIKFLELDKQDLKESRSEMLFTNKISYSSREDFTKLVYGASITGHGGHDKDLSTNYRLGFASGADLYYSEKFGNTISANKNFVEKPEARLGDSGSAMHIYINDKNDQFFAPLNIPRPRVDNDKVQSIQDALKIYPFFGGVNSGLSEKYGIYTTPQSNFNQVLLQNLVYAGKNEPIEPWIDESGKKHERNVSIEKFAAIDIDQYTLKGETYFCNIPTNSRITDNATKSAIISAPPQEISVGSNQQISMELNELEVRSNIQYMKVFFDYVIRAVSNPQYKNLSVDKLEQGEAVDYVSLLVQQAKLRKTILQKEAELRDLIRQRNPRDREMNASKLRSLGEEIENAKSELLAWISDDAGIHLNDGYDMQQAPHTEVGKSLFKASHWTKDCTGTIVNLSEQLGIENNHIYGMMPLHCLGIEWSGKEPATSISELCASQSFQLLTGDDGEALSTPLECRGLNDNDQLTFYPSAIHEKTPWANSEKDIVLFPLKNEYKSRAIKVSTSIPKAERFAFYVIRPNSSVVHGADSSDLFEEPNLDFEKTFVSDTKSTHIMIHDFKTEAGHSGGIIVSRSGSEEPRVVCMHIGSRIPEDSMYIEQNKHRTPSGNRCLQMSVLNEIFRKNMTQTAAVPFETAKELEPVRGDEHADPAYAESFASAIAEVPVTPAPPSVPVNSPTVPMVAVLSGDQPAVALPSIPTSPNTTSSTLSCSQCTALSNCFCCDNLAGLSCNLRSDFPTASKSLDSIPQVGLIPHINGTNAKIYKVLERVRTDSLYPLWLKINVDGQNVWVWSGE